MLRFVSLSWSLRSLARARAIESSCRFASSLALVALTAACFWRI